MFSILQNKMASVKPKNLKKCYKKGVWVHYCSFRPEFLGGGLLTQLGGAVFEKNWKSESGARPLVKAFQPDSGSVRALFSFLGLHRWSWTSWPWPWQWKQWKKQDFHPRFQIEIREIFRKSRDRWICILHSLWMCGN